MTHTLTCLACSVIFTEGEAQRTHYKSDWHRYNLKRKIAELPPVTNGEFQRIVQFHTEKRVEKMTDKSLSCQRCNKNFSSENSYSNHLKSKKHSDLMSKKFDSEISKHKQDKAGSSETGESSKQKTASKIKPKPGYMPPLQIDGSDSDNSDEWEDVSDGDDLSEDDDIVEEEDEDSEALPPTYCLFCPHESVCLEDNFRHMTKSHSFFIPDLKYVIDLEGYFIYLGAKVGDGKVCLKCNNHSKQFISIRACQTHMLDKGHCMLDYEGDAMLEFSHFYDFSPSYPDHGDAPDIDCEFPVNQNDVTVDPDTMELILPSGARAGHRALRRYYNQNINPEQAKTRNMGLITGLGNHYRSLGLTGASLDVAIRRRIHDKKTENYSRAYNRLALGVRNNKVMMKHFRKQNEGGG